MEAKIIFFNKFLKYAKADAINQMFKKITPYDFSHICKIIYKIICENNEEENNEYDNIITVMKKKYNNLIIEDILCDENDCCISNQIAVKTHKICASLICCECLYSLVISYTIHVFSNSISFGFINKCPTITICYHGGASYSNKKISKYFLLIMCKIMRLAVENKMLKDTSMLYQYFTKKIIDDKTLMELLK